MNPPELDEVTARLLGEEWYLVILSSHRDRGRTVVREGDIARVYEWSSGRLIVTYFHDQVNSTMALWAEGPEGDQWTRQP